MNTEEIVSLLTANLNVILTGAPGTGKTYMARQIACKLTHDRFDAAEHPHIECIQFHPGYDYSDFVVGVKPKLDGGQVKFEWVDGIFKTFADKAREHLNENYVLIIDEINRADLSRVFGELFSLLEEDYRYSKTGDTEKNAKGITLPSGDNFVVPRNLYIIGTMNDIDRSVESMDFALRRRFAWVEVKPEDTAGAILSDVPEHASLLAKMNAINEKICSEAFRLGSEYQLGGAIFARYKKERSFESLWDNHIKNILLEYLRGRRDRENLLDALKGVYNEAVGDDNDGGQRAGDLNRTPFRIIFPDRDAITADNRGDGVDALVQFMTYVYNTCGHDGFDQIAGPNGVARGNFPLIVREVPENGARYYRYTIEGYHLHTYSSNAEKVRMINEVSNLLGLNVRAEGLRRA